MDLQALIQLCQVHSDSDMQINPNTKHSTAQPLVIGVDEVGRGTLFGHLSVAAVLMPDALTGELMALDLADTPLSLLNDSKKLTEKRREKLFEPIKTLAYAYAIVDVPRQVIDTINIANATRLGMALAIKSLITQHQLNPQHVQVLIDGNDTPPDLSDVHLSPSQIQTLIQGDARHSTIACASVLAKVHRDRQMVQYGQRYPEYLIEKHKGYLTAAHKAAILKHGILPEHRRSYSPITQLHQDGHLNKKYW